MVSGAMRNKIEIGRQAATIALKAQQQAETQTVTQH